MKKSFKIIVLTLAVAISLSSCYSVKIAAPANNEITLATAYEPLPIKHRVTNWYFLFGSVPISKNTKTDNIISEMNLGKVRIETKMTFGNFLLNAVLNGILPTTVVTNTTIIEGEQKKTDN